MIESIAVLLLLQLLGETLVRLSGAPIPGPVLGMLLLTFLLYFRGQLPERLRNNCIDLLSHLSLLFVPAGVGIMLHLERVAAEWLPLLSAIILSTWLTLAVTAWIMQLAMRRQTNRTTARNNVERICHHE